MDKDAVNRILKGYKDSLIQSDTTELDPQTLGFIHGIEYALAMHERRPVIYVSKDRTYLDYDKERFPEYFL